MPNTENLHEYIIPQTMRAIVLPEPNEAIDLADAELPVPICADNELLVKVEYVGLNPVDGQFAKTGCSISFGSRGPNATTYRSLGGSCTISGRANTSRL